MARLVYDAGCSWCVGAVDFARRHVIEPRPFEPVGSSLALAEGSTGLSVEQCATSVWWIDDEGARGGVDAVAAVLGTMRAPWSWLGAVIARRPVRWIAEPVYRVVARRRPGRRRA